MAALAWLLAIAGLLAASPATVQAESTADAYVSPSVLAALATAQRGEDDASSSAAKSAGRAHVIVSLRGSDAVQGGGAATSLRQEALLDTLDALVPGSYDLIKAFHRVPALAMSIDASALEVLRLHPLVQAINEDSPIRSALSQAKPLTGVDQVHAQGILGANPLGQAGEGIRVLIVDSGIALNAGVLGVLGDDLLGHDCFRINEPACTDGDDVGNGFFSHGTHIAGIYTGPDGVAPASEFYAAKVLTGTLDGDSAPDRLGNVLSALEFALDDPQQFGFDLVNLSLTAGQDAFTLSECVANNVALNAMIGQLNAAGITVFAAAGNGGRLDRIGVPACLPGVIGVGATIDAPNNGDDIRFNGAPGCADFRDGGGNPLPSVPDTADRVACFSSAHPAQDDATRMLDLYAPGSSITSVGLNGNPFPAEGTSFSTPFAGGVAALLLEAARNQGITLTPAQIKAHLRETGVPVPDFRDAAMPLVPRVNAAAAIAGLEPPPPEDDAIFGDSFESANVPELQANLSVTVQLQGSGPFQAGQTVSFLVTIANAGPAAATNVVYSDNVTNLSGLAYSGACIGLPCTIAQLAAGSDVSITVTGTVTAAGAFSYGSSVSATQTDPVPGNNAGSSGGTAGPSDPPIGKRGGLGTNLEGFVDFATAYPVTDMFKQSRPWITSAPNGCTPPPGASCFDTQEADLLDLDADGWVASLPACSDPGQVFCIARTLLNDGSNPQPAGQYLVIYDGQGTISYALGASKVNALSVHGRDVVQVAGNARWQIDISATDPSDPIRNIQVFPPGFDPAVATVPRFHPDFIAELTPYRAIRFMDWMETNGNFGAPNTQENFADRPRVTDAHWGTKKGVPLEIMVELANETGTEPWFTLPHRVNDGYVDGFAEIVRDQLDPNLDIYLEFSNEVWNGSFPQGNEVEQLGNTLFPGLGDPFIRRLNAHGVRTANICQRFKAVFGGQADRVICTLGAQAANAFTQTEAADCPLAIQVGLRTTPCHADMDAVAIAPYFGNYTNVPVNENEVELWTLNDLFDDMTDSGRLFDAPPNVATPCTENFPQIPVQPCPVPALDEVIPWIDAHKSAANTRSLRLVAYEGGQHYVGVFGVQDNQTITNLFMAANRDARMRPAYLRYLQTWKDGGGELFANFALSGAYGRFGSWGLLEQLQQNPRPPKAVAIDEFNEANPCWWPNCD